MKYSSYPLKYMSFACSWEVKNVSIALWVWLPASRSQSRSQGSSAPTISTGKTLIFWDCENVCRRSSPCFRFAFVAVFSLLVFHQQRLSDFMHNVPLKSISMPCIRSRIYNYSPKRSKAYMLLFLPAPKKSRKILRLSGSDFLQAVHAQEVKAYQLRQFQRVRLSILSAFNEDNRINNFLLFIFALKNALFALKTLIFALEMHLIKRWYFPIFR